MEGSNGIDFSLASEGVNEITTGITTFFTTNWPYVLGVVAIPIGFWLVRFCIRLIKSLSSSGK